MPRVPVLTGPSVAPQGLPVPRLSGASPADFGAGLGRGLQDAGAALQQFAEIQRDKADTLRLIEFQSHLDATEHDLVVTGAMSRRGKDALGVYDDTLKAWDGATGELVSGLSGSRQKTAAAEMVARRRSAIGNTLEAHTARETQAYAADLARTGVQSAGDLAISYATDPTRRAQAIAQGEGVIRATSATNGLDPAGALAEFRSNVHQGIIERLLANDQDQAAAAYLTEYRGEIQGSALARLENAVQDGSTLATAMREADQITGSAKDRGEALAAVRELTDPKVRAAAQSEVNQFYSEREAVARERERQLFEGASDELERNGGSLTRLRTTLGAGWLDLDQNSRVALEGRAKQKREEASGVPAVTDSRAYTEFLLLPPAKMAAVEPLRDLRAKLSNGDYEQAVRQVAAAREYLRTGKDTAGLVGEGISFNERALTGAESAGIVPLGVPVSTWSLAQATAFNEFRSRAEVALEEEQASKGRRLTVEEKQGVMDRLTVKVSLDRSWLRDSQVPGLTIPDEDVEQAYLPLAQVPDDGKESILRMIRNANGVASDRKVERIAAVLALSSIGRLDAATARARMLAIAQEAVEE